MRENEKSKGEELPTETSAKGFGKSLRWEVRWRKKSYGTSLQIERWKTEEPFPEKTETCSVNTEPRTRKTFSAVPCGRMWNVNKEKGG